MEPYFFRARTKSTFKLANTNNRQSDFHPKAPRSSVTSRIKIHRLIEILSKTNIRYGTKKLKTANITGKNLPGAKVSQILIGILQQYFFALKSNENLLSHMVLRIFKKFYYEYFDTEAKPCFANTCELLKKTK